jgi:hypothetical protein
LQMSFPNQTWRKLMANKKERVLSALICVGPVILCAIGYAADVTLAWDANQENDLEGYGVYFSSGTDGPPYDFFGYISTAELNNGNSPTFTITGLQQDATYYFAVSAYDTSGNESAYSSSVCAQVGVTVTVCPSADTTPANPSNPSSGVTAPAYSASGGGGGGGCFISTVLQ